VNNQRRGVTLIELVVVLAILGVMAAVTGLTMNTATPAASLDATIVQITHLRDSALTTGRPVTAILTHHDTAIAVTAFPDGRVLSTGGNIDRMTGRAHDSR
jgi:prepilin-type N-terminal cleavage/methylation domain-containing protein